MKRTITIEFDLDTEGRQSILNRVLAQLNAYREEDRIARKHERRLKNLTESPVAERNLRIVSEYLAGGISKRALAAKYDLSPSRVDQIIARHQWLTREDAD